MQQARWLTVLALGLSIGSADARQRTQKIRVNRLVPPDSPVDMVGAVNISGLSSTQYGDLSADIRAALDDPQRGNFKKEWPLNDHGLQLQAVQVGDAGGSTLKGSFTATASEKKGTCKIAAVDENGERVRDAGGQEVMRSEVSYARTLKLKAKWSLVRADGTVLASETFDVKREGRTCGDPETLADWDLLASTGRHMLAVKIANTIAPRWEPLQLTVTGGPDSARTLATRGQLVESWCALSAHTAEQPKDGDAHKLMGAVGEALGWLDAADAAYGAAAANGSPSGVGPARVTERRAQLETLSSIYGIPASKKAPDADQCAPPGQPASLDRAAKLFDGPGANATVLQKLDKGAEVTLFGMEGDRARVRSADGTEGWVDVGRLGG